MAKSSGVIMADSTNASARPSGPSGLGNLGEPLRFEKVQPLAGVAANSVRRGERVAVLTRHAVSSDEPSFHAIVEGLNGVIQHMAKTAGIGVCLQRANTVLWVIRPDRSAELWIDTAAVSLQIRAKRSLPARSVVFANDVADVTAMEFPCVTIGEEDQVVCLFREGWSFGLAFDFGADGTRDTAWFPMALGTLHRTLRYRHQYQAVNTPAIFDLLVATGWFPFAEIITAEFPELARAIENGFGLDEVETNMLAAFDAARLANLLQRWIAKPHFAARSALLTEAIDCFTSQRPAAVIKIVLTEIEGALNDAHKAAHGGQGAKLKALLAFAQASAEQRAGRPDTLMFPAAFGRYLADHTFANFDPVAGTGKASSRHAVGHGAAAQDSYTMTRALQALLTLDQLAFYT
jgi:hypothetical protein